MLVMLIYVKNCSEIPEHSEDSGLLYLFFLLNTIIPENLPIKLQNCRTAELQNFINFHPWYEF